MLHNCCLSSNHHFQLPLLSLRVLLPPVNERRNQIFVEAVFKIQILTMSCLQHLCLPTWGSQLSYSIRGMIDSHRSLGGAGSNHITGRDATWKHISCINLRRSRQSLPYYINSGNARCNLRTCTVYTYTSSWLRIYTVYRAYAPLQRRIYWLCVQLLDCATLYCRRSEFPKSMYKHE